VMITSMPIIQVKGRFPSNDATPAITAITPQISRNNTSLIVRLRCNHLFADGDPLLSSRMRNGLRPSRIARIPSLVITSPLKCASHGRKPPPRAFPSVPGAGVESDLWADAPPHVASGKADLPASLEECSRPAR